jgi:hypothetical protein
MLDDGECRPHAFDSSSLGSVGTSRGLCFIFVPQPFVWVPVFDERLIFLHQMQPDKTKKLAGFFFDLYFA